MPYSLRSTFARRARAAALLSAVMSLGSSCAAGQTAVPGAAPPAARAASPSVKGVLRPLVLVTIDGARWQDAFNGDLVPNLARLGHDRGVVVGAPGRGRIVATGPNFVSLPGYTELFTGRAPIDCQDNDCAKTRVPTILDQAAEAGAKVAAFASWERLERAVSASSGRFRVSCGRGGDPSIAPFPGSGDFRPDHATAEVALSYLERERPDVLFVGLGDTDEYAHMGDRASYARALSYADEVVGRILDVLAGMGERGARTDVIVTADHGRAHDFKDHGAFAPESARVWLYAAGPSFASRGAVVSSAERHLADVAPTLREVLGLPGDESALAGEPIAEILGRSR